MSIWLTIGFQSGTMNYMKEAESHSSPGRVVVAGATGYLGRHLVVELAARGFEVAAIVRPGKSAPGASVIIEAQVTEPASLVGVLDGAVAVFSALGVTRQNDAVSYHDIEFQANLNLLREAERAGVPRFGVISAVNPEVFAGLAILESREQFIAELKTSSVESLVVRATGFFSDMSDLFDMAKSGRAYTIGNGTTQTNPIHGADLAKVCADALVAVEPPPHREIDTGGPDTYSWNEIARLAFDALGTRPKITHVPAWIPKLLLPALKPFRRRTYDIAQFIVHGSLVNMTAPPHGTHHLRDTYAALANPTGEP